jgi:hypothetical protein
VFDRMFGTFAAERDDLPCRYGLTTPLRSNNPIVIDTNHARSCPRARNHGCLKGRFVEIVRS